MGRGGGTRQALLTYVILSYMGGKKLNILELCFSFLCPESAWISFVTFCFPRILFVSHYTTYAASKMKVNKL